MTFSIEVLGERLRALGSAQSLAIAHSTGGFGSKPIDMNLRFELSGTMSRTFRADGLHIEMRVSLASVLP